jgi:hypothetical protein
MRPRVSSKFSKKYAGERVHGSELLQMLLVSVEARDRPRGQIGARRC